MCNLISSHVNNQDETFKKDQILYSFFPWQMTWSLQITPKF